MKVMKSKAFLFSLLLEIICFGCSSLHHRKEIAYSRQTDSLSVYRKDSMRKASRMQIGTQENLRMSQVVYSLPDSAKQQYVERVIFLEAGKKQEVEALCVTTSSAAMSAVKIEENVQGKEVEKTSRGEIFPRWVLYFFLFVIGYKICASLKKV